VPANWPFSCTASRGWHGSALTTMTHISAADSPRWLSQARTQRISVRGVGQIRDQVAYQSRNWHRIVYVLLLCGVAPVHAFWGGPSGGPSLGGGLISPLGDSHSPCEVTSGERVWTCYVSARAGKASRACSGRGASTMGMFATGAGAGGYGSIPSRGGAGASRRGRVRRAAAAVSVDGPPGGEAPSNR
jgi:hypothetical protein